MTGRASLLAGMIACAVFVQRSAFAQSAPAEARSAGLRYTDPNGFSMALAAGANYAQVFSVPTYGGEVSALFGGRTNKLYRSVGFSLERGRTEEGLEINGFHLLGVYDYKLGIVKIGVAGRLGYWNVQRATGSGSLESGSIGLALRGGLDLLEISSETTLFLQAELRGDVYGEAPVFNPNLSLGVRWDPPHRL